MFASCLVISLWYDSPHQLCRQASLPINLLSFMLVEINLFIDLIYYSHIFSRHKVHYVPLLSNTTSYHHLLNFPALHWLRCSVFVCLALILVSIHQWNWYHAPDQGYLNTRANLSSRGTEFYITTPAYASASRCMLVVKH